MRRHGFTLIEMILYIGIIAILVPGIGLFTTYTTQRQQNNAQHLSIQATAESMFGWMRYELQHATAIIPSQSVFNTTTSSLRFIDRGGVTTTVTTAPDTYTAEGQQRTISRVRKTHASTNEWLTGNDITVSAFTMNPIRTTTGTLVGITLEISIAPHVLNSGAATSQVFTTRTSIWLPAYVQEQ